MILLAHLCADTLTALFPETQYRSARHGITLLAMVKRHTARL